MQREVLEENQEYDTERILKRVHNIETQNNEKYMAIPTPDFKNSNFNKPNMNAFKSSSQFSKYGKKMTLRTKNIECQNKKINKSSLSKGNYYLHFYYFYG